MVSLEGVVAVGAGVGAVAVGAVGVVAVGVGAAGRLGSLVGVVALGVRGLGEVAAAVGVGALVAVVELMGEGIAVMRVRRWGRGIACRSRSGQADRVGVVRVWVFMGSPPFRSVVVVRVEVVLVGVWGC